MNEAQSDTKGENLNQYLVSEYLSSIFHCRNRSKNMLFWYCLKGSWLRNLCSSLESVTQKRFQLHGGQRRAKEPTPDLLFAGVKDVGIEVHIPLAGFLKLQQEGDAHVGLRKHGGGKTAFKIRLEEGKRFNRSVLSDLRREESLDDAQAQFHPFLVCLHVVRVLTGKQTKPQHNSTSANDDYKAVFQENSTSNQNVIIFQTQSTVS